MSYSAQVAILKYHRIGGLNNTFTSHSSGGWNCEIKVPVNLVPDENPSGFQRTIFSLCPHMLERESSGVSFLVCVLNSSVVPDSSATVWTVALQAPLSMGVSQERILQWVAISFSRGIFLTQGLNPCLLHLLHWQADS